MSDQIRPGPDDAEAARTAELERQMALARRIMVEEADVLRELARS